MANSAVAVLDNTYGSVIITVDFSASPTATGVGATVNLVRNYPNGTTQIVRGSPARLAAGMAVFGDNELPMGTVIFYTATSPQVTGVSLVSNSVTLTGSGVPLAGFLKDPAVPAFDVPLTAIVPLRSSCDTVTGIGLEIFEAETLTSSSGIFSVINDPRPRIISMPRKDATGLFRLVTEQLSDAALVDALLASGRPLLLEFNPAAGLGWGYATYGVDYVAISDLGVARMPSPVMAHSQREFAHPYSLCYAPPNVPTGQYGGNGIGVRGATWGDLRASGLTWRTLSGSKAADNFNRTSASTWGNDDNGDAYTLTGGAGTDFNVAPFAGTMNLTSVNVTRQARLATISMTNTDMYVTVASNGLAVGATTLIDAILRWTSTANMYLFRVTINTNASITASIVKIVAGTTTVIATGTVAGITYLANMGLRIRAQINGTTLRMKVFRFGTPEQTAWDQTITDAALAGPGQPGVQAIVNTSGTVPRVISFSRLSMDDLDVDETWLQVAQGVGY